jgi:adenylate cyclase class 2
MLTEKHGPMPPDHIEIEVKFLVTDIAALRLRLKSMGANSRGEVLETNYRYDDQAGRLLAARSLLRLRQDRRTRLTFKRPRSDGRDQFKVYDEYEVTVDDFGGMHRILTAMGFQRVQIYEKRREVFRWRQTQFCIDRLPFGNFVEIEGSPEAIRAGAHRLKLPWKRRILANYLQLFEALRTELKLAFQDLTFDHMPERPEAAADIIRRFEASPYADEQTAATDGSHLQ